MLGDCTLVHEVWHWQLKVVGYHAIKLSNTSIPTDLKQQFCYKSTEVVSQT